MNTKRARGGRYRKQSFRAAFVVTVSVGAAASEGCEADACPPDWACNPPMPTCPEEAPDEGANCEPASAPCSYDLDTACGPKNIRVDCETDVGSETASWHYEPPVCAPTTPACGTYEVPSLCNADTTCRWLTPGCDDPMLTAFEAGCYPIDDCTAASCGANAVCTDVSYNPCFQSTCEACGAPASLCIAQDG